MPLDAGDPGYGSVPAAPVHGLPGTVGVTETAPLLIPEPELEPVTRWQPLSMEELELAAGGPGWRKFRSRLVLLFWLTWLAILGTAVAIIIKSPKPVATPLKWWQKSLFYQLQPPMFIASEGPVDINDICEQFPYLKSLGIGVLILSDMFDKKASPANLNVTDENVGTIPQIQHLLMECHKADLKVVLDLCELDLLGPGLAAGNVEEHALKFWLDQGVTGFAICDTDAVYSEKTLLRWRDLMKKYTTNEDEERIVVVKQMGDVLLPLNTSEHTNVTLVHMVIRSILQSTNHLLSPQEVAVSIETHLQTSEDIWPSWTVGGKTSHDLKKLLLVLMMTLPGSPAIQYGEGIGEVQGKVIEAGSIALFTSLSHYRSREETLLYGTLKFLPFNSSSLSNSTFPPSPTSILAFLRSWGCVHFLVLLNLGSEPRELDPTWLPILPEGGVFVTSTEMDRSGAIDLAVVKLRPHEAIVIKLFEAGSYS
ncbi:amino acid transporter heavy chain SLC3A2 [Genypterus blacodes]|uniref:amino acid transporter heavy chain SLC3A2 n=1 Tax=Genypterus blacodes TaxID=154954 RepID=UPI003F76626A